MAAIFVFFTFILCFLIDDKFPKRQNRESSDR